jgi:RNA polymerase sigma factor (sigma-70 family)
MPDFDFEAAREMAEAHAAWAETGSEDARNRLFGILDDWVRKQAHFMLVRRYGASRQAVTTGTFAQDVLTKLLTRLNRIEYRGLPQLLGYILSALRTYLIDVAQNHVAHQLPLSEVDSNELAAVTMAELRFDSESSTVTVVAGQSSKLIDALTILGRIEGIDPRHGQALQLQVLAGFTIAEIAEQLRIAPVDVDRMLRHARTKFRHEWKKTSSALGVGDSK